jgi:peptide/nickel transport system permease protein
MGNVMKVLLSSGVGRIGLALLAFLVGISAYVLLSYPLDYGTKVWYNPAAWADYPPVKPPVWATPGAVPHTVLRTTVPEETQPKTSGGESRLYRLVIEHPYDQPPDFLSLTITEIVYYGRPPLFTVRLARPDGREVRLYRYNPPAPRRDETAPYVRHAETPYRVNLGADPQVRAQVAAFLRTEFQMDVSTETLRGKALLALFSEPDPERPGEFRPLPGRYEVRVRVDVGDPRDRAEEIRVVRGGSAFGLMGTDSLGRDLAQGLLFGFPVSLLIGVLASTLVTLIGATLGIMSGFLGGKVDLSIQRLADVVNNIPGLPLLIFMVFILGPKLFLVIIPVLVFFGWPGITIVVRSMVLQLREGQLVEAERSIGSSRGRIMFRHILPQVAPYLLAQLIFFAPSAILAEATLSFIGLGDPSLPTWGQMLEGAFRTGAVYRGYWWWVVPPGLLIVLTAVTFMLLALAMEPLANPRLRRT